MKKKSTLVYPNIPSAIRPVPHGDGLSVPEPPDNFAMYSDDEDSVSSNSEEQQPSASRDTDYLPSTDSSNHKFTEGEPNDLIRDIELPKNKAELLASRLQQWHLLHHKGKWSAAMLGDIAGWRKGMLLKQNTIERPKGHYVKVNNFLFIFMVHITMIVLLPRKQELTSEFYNYFRILHPKQRTVYSLIRNIQWPKICWTVLLANWSDTKSVHKHDHSLYTSAAQSTQTQVTDPLAERIVSTSWSSGGTNRAKGSANDAASCHRNRVTFKFVCHEATNNRPAYQHRALSCYHHITSHVTECIQPRSRAHSCVHCLKNLANGKTSKRAEHLH